MLILISILILILIFLGLPLYMGIFALAVTYSLEASIPLLSLLTHFDKLQSQEFVSAIPLFTFAGYVLSKSRSPERITQFFQSNFSFLPGSSYVVVVAIMAIFTSLTGASGISILALGSLMYTLLYKLNQNRYFSIGVITSSGSIGLLFAPSLPVIIYAMIASQNAKTTVNIDTLFKIALIPSFILILAIIVYSLVYDFLSKKKKKITLPKIKYNFQEAKASLWKARYEVLLPFMIYGGIYSGIVTVLEVAILTVIYVIIITFLLTKDLNFKKDFVNNVVESAKLSGSILIIMVMAFALVDYFVNENIADKLFLFLSKYITNKYVFLLVLNIFLLICGCLLDIFSAILITLPILIPIVERYDINIYHFAIIFLINLEIGYLTPPIGMNLFIASYRFKEKIMTLYKSTLPFLLVMIAVLLCVTYTPYLSTFLLKKENTPIAKSSQNITIETINVEQIVENKIYLLGYLGKGKIDDIEKVVVTYLDLHDPDILEFNDFAEEITLDFNSVQTDQSSVTNIINTEDLTFKKQQIFSFVITSFEKNTDYFFKVKFISKSGKESNLSTGMNITTQ